MPLTEEPGLYKRPYPCSFLHVVFITNTLSGALYLRPLLSALRTSSLSHLLTVFPLSLLPATVTGRCITRQLQAVEFVRYFYLILYKNRSALRLLARWQS